jgi:oligopeptide/dipeptide ABC transporter ATP-binding protein
MALLEVRDLKTYFPSGAHVIRAVDGVSFSVEPGRTLGIVGESGCGKSVTALTIMGLIRRPPAIVEGSVLLNGTDLTRLPRRQLEDIRGRRIGMIFQDPMSSLNPTMKIGTQIIETVQRHLHLSRSEARKRAVELLEAVRIPNAAARLNDYPHQFSGGMRQRVMIAMAVSCEPQLLIADEPTTALDVTVQAEILDVLKELQRERGMAMIMITHDMGVVVEVAHDVIVMYAGQAVEQAPATELFDHPEHPYTEALLAALPRIEADRTGSTRLAAIPGQPPDPHLFPPGCRFAPRCPYAHLGDDCATTVQQLSEIRPRHWVRSAHPASCRNPWVAARAVEPEPDRLVAGATPAEPLLRVSGLKKYYGRRAFGRGEGDQFTRAVDDVSFDIKAGETLGLVGESGSGKSTTALCILQLVRPTAGSIRFEGRELTDMSASELRKVRPHMQIVFQDPYSSLDPRMTIQSIVAEPLRIHHIGTRTERERWVAELLDLVGLSRRHLERFPHELSGGQRQRVGIARALALHPRLIICDEPVSALDVSIRAQILNLLRDLQRDLGLTYLFIAHDLAVVRFMSDRIVVMRSGRVVETGVAEKVYRSPTHQYTQELLAAIPVPDPRRARRQDRVSQDLIDSEYSINRIGR